MVVQLSLVGYNRLSGSLFAAVGRSSRHLDVWPKSGLKLYTKIATTVNAVFDIWNSSPGLSYG